MVSGKECLFLVCQKDKLSHFVCLLNTSLKENLTGESNLQCTVLLCVLFADVIFIIHLFFMTLGRRWVEQLIA